MHSLQCPGCGLVLATAEPPSVVERRARSATMLAELAKTVARYRAHNDGVQARLLRSNVGGSR